MERHRVYCEVTPQEVVFQHGAETHLGLARFGIVLLAAESCDLDNNIGIKETYRPKTLADKDNRIRMRWRDDLLDFVWLGIGCHVRVVGLLAMQQQIAYRPSYNIELFVLRVKSFRQRDDNILHDEQYIPVSIVLVQCDYCIMAYLCWLVIKSYGFRSGSSGFGFYHFFFGLVLFHSRVLRGGLIRVFGGGCGFCVFFGYQVVPHTHNPGFWLCPFSPA